MAKKKNGKKKQGATINANQALYQRIGQLESQMAPKAGKPKKKRAKKKQKRVSHGATLANFSPFARGYLDPFGARGVRVPDSVLLKSGTTTHRWFLSGSTDNFAVPSFNYTSSSAYGTIVVAPLPRGIGTKKPMHFSFTPDPTKSFFDYSGNATPNVTNYSKTFGDTNIQMNYEPFAAPLGKAFRLSAGGVKVCFFNIPDTIPVDLYAIPTFNGDNICSDWSMINAKRVRHFRLRSNDEVVLPIPIRHIGEAFEWINAGKIGVLNTDYPGDDGVATADIMESYVTTASTDCTATNSAVKAWSLQSGIGGWQLAFNLPPGAGWRSEVILHYEVMASTAISTGFLSEGDTQISYANNHLMETVANVVGYTATQESVLDGACATPWQDLVSHMSNTSVNALAQKLQTDMILEGMSQMGLGGARR